MSHNFNVFARLKPGVTMAQAVSEMDRIGKDLEKQYPQFSRGHGAHVTSLPDEITGPVSLKRGLRFGLIVAEVAVTSLLLVGAGLTLRSLQTVLSQDAGIETENRLTFRIGLSGARYKGSEAALRFFSELEDRLAAEPIIRGVGGTMLPPLTGLDGRRGVVIENREVGPGDGPTRAHPRVVTTNYLQAAGARVREGRGFVASDTATSTPVAVVNETMAKRYWPGASAIGGRVRFSDQEAWRAVVGIIADVKHWGLDAPVNPELYVPTSQFPTFALTFVLLTNGTPLGLVPIAHGASGRGVKQQPVSGCQ